MFHKRSSVINLIYSGQQLFSYGGGHSPSIQTEGSLLKPPGWQSQLGNDLSIAPMDLTNLRILLTQTLPLKLELWWEIWMRYLKVSFTLAKFVRDNACDITMSLHALASLGSSTQIGSFLSWSSCSRWPRQVQVCHCYVSLLPALLC